MIIILARSSIATEHKKWGGGNLFGRFNHGDKQDTPQQQQLRDSR